ncbi:MAG: endonuclease domain-containing protein [Bacteroidia bacterium]|nr:endonuclease domain-containing protein [Bacteroidia bacterium]
MRSRVIERNMFYGASRNIFERVHGLRKKMTLTEKIMWEELKNTKLFKVKFRRQHPIDIFIVDFYCHELKLAIEIDGEIHLKEEIKEYDNGRIHDIEKLGIKILRFTNDEVRFHKTRVVKKIIVEIANLKLNSEIPL